jgi:hypothetical protein
VTHHRRNPYAYSRNGRVAQLDPPDGEVQAALSVAPDAERTSTSQADPSPLSKDRS